MFPHPPPMDESGFAKINPDNELSQFLKHELHTATTAAVKKALADKIPTVLKNMKIGSTQRHNEAPDDSTELSSSNPSMAEQIQQRDTVAGCRVAVRKELKEAMDEMRKLVTHAEGINRSLLQLPVELENFLKKEDPDNLIRAGELESIVRDAMRDSGTIIHIPTMPKTKDSTDPPAVWVKHYLDEALQRLEHKVDTNTMAIEHTFPPSSMSLDKVTPEKLSNLIFHLELEGLTKRVGDYMENTLLMANRAQKEDTAYCNEILTQMQNLVQIMVTWSGDEDMSQDEAGFTPKAPQSALKKKKVVAWDTANDGENEQAPLISTPTTIAALQEVSVKIGNISAA